MSRLVLTCINSSSLPLPRAFLARWIRACETELRPRLSAAKARALRGELTLVFLDRKPARALNFEFRGKDYATDVLSFAAEGAFGELVLCPQVLKSQARQHGLGFREELGYLTLHGLLHLLGYDHETSPAAAKRMFRLQDEVFENLQRSFFASARRKKAGSRQ